MVILLILLLGFPLLGAMLLALTGRWWARRAVELWACGTILASFVVASMALVRAGQQIHFLELGPWFGVDGFQVSLQFYYDPLTAAMALMVTLVSVIVHIYSVPYMRAESDYVRYFCFLNLFVFGMLLVTVAGNLVLFYLGWEAVGLCSYALIGFWYGKPEAAAASRKAFVVTRLGDVAFGVAIALCWTHLGQISVPAIHQGASSLPPNVNMLLGLLLLWAAVGKSAQLPLAVWLPDAMTGPTPVSALIHAATMVTAGVYLLMRFFPVIHGSPEVMLLLAGIGVATACYGACGALVQRDIKRILAYSTISQVGYLFLAVGAGDIVGSMFHLLSHAFFKSLLFLAAGCIVQSLHEEHDIFRMSGLRQRSPELYWLFLAATVSLGALPLAGGFFSKDRILLATFVQTAPHFRTLWWLAMLGAVLTPLYAFRLLFVVFFEESGKQTERSPINLSPWMVRILWPLALLSVFDGFLNLPGNWTGKEWLARYLAPVPGALAKIPATVGVEWAMQIGCGLMTVLVIIFAWFHYGPKNRFGGRSPVTLPALFHNLFLSGFYLDRIFQALIVQPFRELGRLLWQKADEEWLDGFLELTAGAFLTLGGHIRYWTSGRISTYVGMVLLGFVLILSILVVTWWAA
ncbi:MAG TPA: NADH-quinone oxidoreductase subunit L [Syntrophobacteraceae bacterium]|nr:NADH-quinone oxidoreductase subunit L [Syntrophobacteraceae bacterium]